jgi:uncharacterized membrane protein
MPKTLSFDPSDPVLALATLLLAEVLKRLAPSLAERLSPVLPLVVVLLAVALRALVDAVSAEGLTWSSVLRGLAAAGVAVLTHAQFRSVAKAVADRKPDEPTDEGKRAAVG